MFRKFEQSKNRGDSSKIPANREKKSKPLDVCASSQKLRDEQKAISQNFIGITREGHPSASGKEKDFSSRDQSSDTEQVLRNNLKLVGNASTRDLSKRVTDVSKRSNQVGKSTW